MATPEPATTAATIRTHLDTLTDAWPDTADPMNAGHGGGGTETALPSSTIVLRADITLTLAYWCHALIDAAPVVLQHLQPGPDGKLTVITGTLDCTNVTDMARLLHREADRIAEHWDDGQYAPRLIDELEPLARTARAVSRPPRKDRITLGHCACGGHIAARAVPWTRVPNPTTDPTAYPAWSDWQPAHEQAIRCPGCHTTRTVPEWLAEIVGPQRLVDAGELVELIHADLGMRYTPAAVRVWVNRRLIEPRGKARDGRNLYDRAQVYAALVNRDRQAATA